MPRTLAQNAQYIAETIKPAIKSAIEAQGVTVPSTDSFLDYADRIGEIEGGGSGYQLKDLPTGSISTVNDAAELPLNALKVSVEAWQEGSGDPSPSNVRPIHGWDSGEINVVGKNQAHDIVYTNATRQYVTIIFAKYHLVAGKSYVVSFMTENTGVEIYRETPNALGFASLTPFNLVCDGTRKYLYGTANSTGDFDGFMIRRLSGTSEVGTGLCSEFMIEEVASGVTAPTTYEPYQGNQYTQQFPQTIYGAEWDVVDGVLSQTDGYIASYNGETLPSTWISDRDVYDGTNTPTIGAEVVYKLATPQTIDLSPLSIRMLQGTNNVYADCGDIIEGEYFVDEGAIDVRKVDYSIGSNSALKISDGRILQGFANMANYHSRPLDASGNWLDVDWSKDFEIGVAFKFTAFPAYQGITGDGNANSYRKAPRLYYDNSEGKLDLCVSSNGSTLAIDQYLNYAFATDKWYFIKAKFVLSTMAFSVDISDDFATFTNLYTGTMSNAPYHNTASLCFGGDAQQSNMASNTFLIDTFNTYIKGDGVNWGASTGAFPS